jgi:hypothetical protein
MDPIIAWRNFMAEDHNPSGLKHTVIQAFRQMGHFITNNLCRNSVQCGNQSPAAAFNTPRADGVNREARAAQHRTVSEMPPSTAKTSVTVSDFHSSIDAVQESRAPIPSPVGGPLIWIATTREYGKRNQQWQDHQR